MSFLTRYEDTSGRGKCSCCLFPAQSHVDLTDTDPSSVTAMFMPFSGQSRSFKLFSFLCSLLLLSRTPFSPYLFLRLRLSSSVSLSLTYCPREIKCLLHWFSKDMIYTYLYFFNMRLSYTPMPGLGPALRESHRPTCREMISMTNKSEFTVSLPSEP